MYELIKHKKKYKKQRIILTIAHFISMTTIFIGALFICINEKTLGLSLACLGLVEQCLFGILIVIKDYKEEKANKEELL